MLYILFFLASFASLSLITGGLFIKISHKEIVIERRISDFLRTNNFRTKIKEPTIRKGEDETEKSFVIRILLPLWQNLRKLALEKMTTQTTKTIEKKLIDAGRPFGLSAVDFRIIQIGIGVAFFLIVLLLFAPGSKNIGLIIILAVVAGVYGTTYPFYYLNMKKKMRGKEIQKEMPDFFDMLTLSIEAGMGFDQALTKVCRQFKGPLSNEFHRMLEDLKLGKSRYQAFSELRERVQSELFQSVISAIIQADQLGIGMAKVLKSLTQRIREKRREEAREQAMKTPVKMLFPIVIFIFPAIFVVILGPLACYFLINGTGM